MNNLIWKPLKYQMIPEGYLISNTGFIRNKDCDESDYLTADYHSSNGYDYILLIVKEEYRVNNSIFMLFPIDELLASAFIYIPEELTNKRITVKHIDGNTRNIELTNLEWIEDVEEWRECTYPGIPKNKYEVSSWGRIRLSNTILPLFTDYRGYYRKIISGKEFKIHRLVAWEFCKYSVDFMSNHINHINGCKYINTPKNLEVVTKSQNSIHAFLTCLIDFSCENSPHTSVKNLIVEHICELIVAYNGNLQTIIKKLHEENIHVSTSLLYRIKNKESWNQISDKYFKKDMYRSYPKYLTPKDVKLLCKLQLKYPYQCKKIKYEAEKLGINVSLSQIKHIVYKYSFKEISDKYF